MPYNPLVHHRRSIRLDGYDYGQAGAYFVTMVTRDHACLFEDPLLHRLVTTHWLKLPGRFPAVDLDAWVLMPNHLHGIILISGAQDNDRPALDDLICLFKSLTGRASNRIRQVSGAQLWQRNYYEHIIRNERELNDVRKYIAENPEKWELDENHPARRP